MATTLRLLDYLGRTLTNATPGTSDATDFIGRDVVASDLDYLGRDLIGTTWAGTTAYALGDYTVLSTDEVLKVTVAGTSGASEPTPPGYGDTVVDATVTWEQVSA